MFSRNCNSEHKPVLNTPEYNHSGDLIVLSTFCLYGLECVGVWVCVCGGGGRGCAWGVGLSSGESLLM